MGIQTARGDALPSNQLSVLSPAELSRREWLLEHLLIAMNGDPTGLSDFASDIRVANAAATLIWREIRHLSPAYLIGCGLQSMHLLHAVAFAALREERLVRLLMIRESRKGHNRKKWIEGEPPKVGASAVLISDFFADEDSFAFAQQALKSENYSIQLAAMVAICKLSQKMHRSEILPLPPIHTLFSAEEVLMDRENASVQYLLSERQVFLNPSFRSETHRSKDAA